VEEGRKKEEEKIIDIERKKGIEYVSVNLCPVN